MSYDLNDVELPRGAELIPDGSFVKVTMLIRPGGVDGRAEPDRELLARSQASGSDVVMLNAEFTVAAGPYMRRKLWQNFTVEGGKLDERGVSIGGKISMGWFRAMVDSAFGLDPHDKSEAAASKRVLRGLSDLNGIIFAAKVRVEANDSRYGDANRLERVVLPGDAEYRAIMEGEAVPAQPTARRARATPATSSAAWAPPTRSVPGGAAAGQPAHAGARPAAWERPASLPQAPQSDATPAPTGPAWLND
jgi:hypothetical protein